MSSSSSWKPAPSTPFGDPATHKSIDPYLLWAAYTDFAVNGPVPERVGVLIERATKDAKHSRRRGSRFIDSLQSANALNEGSPYISASVSRNALPALAAAVDSGLLRRFELSLPRGALTDYLPVRATSSSLPSSVAGQTSLRGTSGACHVIGVVDDGCCLAHERLRSGCESHFAWVWDQGSSSNPSDPYWHSAPDLPYGVEMTRHSINAALKRAPAIGQAGEAQFYNLIGRPQWGVEGRTHGAGILHALAHSDARDAEEHHPLIFVQMPTSTVIDTSGASLGQRVVDGARYIIRRAQQLAHARRCSTWSATINLSLGSLAGPHDGSTITELALQSLCAQPNVDIIVAAGNAATWRTHARRTIRSAEPGAFHVMVPPDSARELYVEVWFPPGVADPASGAKLSIEVTSPDGVSSGRTALGHATTLNNSGEIAGGLMFVRHPAQSPDSPLAVLAFRPTSQSRGPAYGVWTVTVRTSNSRPVEVHGWIQRNDTIVPPRRAQRGWFVEDGTGYVEETMTLGSLGNGSGTIVAGAYRVVDRTAADYSGRGPTRRITGRRDVDYYGSSDFAAFQPGLPVPGFFSGTYARASGTSLAAPQVCAWVARGRPGADVVKIAAPTGPRPGISYAAPD